MRNTLQDPVSTDADPASKKTVPARTVASWKQNLQQPLHQGQCSAAYPGRSGQGSSNFSHNVFQVHSYLTAALSDYYFDHIDQNYIYTMM